jgi:hypothetical protein
MKGFEMRKSWKRSIVAVAAACAVLSGIPGIAMAEDTISYDSTATAFTKVWEAASNQQLNDTEEFTFTRSFSEYDGSSYDSDATASDGAKTEKPTLPQQPRGRPMQMAALRHLTP